MLCYNHFETKAFERKCKKQMSTVKNSAKTDFSVGPAWKCIVAQAIPLTVAQLVQLLYNVVDRIYLGHMGDGNSMALTGVGLTFPVVSLIMAFTALFGNGGVPLFAIKRGAGEEKTAGKILGNSFALLLCSSLILTVAGYAFTKPVLFAFGAGEESYIYAKEYLDVYLLGTVFSMIATGMNGYINAQGFPKIGMWSVTIGAVCNIALDPIFIFGLNMGVAGAALATIISQAVSAVWVLHFLTGKKAIIPLRRNNISIDKNITADICKLGISNFIMQGTNCLVQVACNKTLQTFGGDLYIGIMTVTNSVREVFNLPVMGIVNGAQPVISYNYGAKQYERVRSGINFNTIIGAGYTLIAWLLVIIFPQFWFGIFSDDVQMLSQGIEAMKIYFFGFVFMSLQFAGQSTFQAVGDAKHAIFFSLLRKVVIVVPLTLVLPRLGLGVIGVFAAEPVSNIFGGIASYLTMRMTVYKKIKNKEDSKVVKK
jgi:putative MATE family efflux protein